MKIEIRSLAGKILFEGDFSCLADAVSAAVRSRMYLAGYAQVSFSAHGECGRMLIVYRKTGDSPWMAQCGCFSGTYEDLLAYIEKGAEALKPSRRLCAETALMLAQQVRASKNS